MYGSTSAHRWHTRQHESQDHANRPRAGSDGTHRTGGQRKAKKQIYFAMVLTSRIWALVCAIPPCAGSETGLVSACRGSSGLPAPRPGRVRTNLTLHSARQYAGGLPWDQLRGFVAGLEPMPRTQVELRVGAIRVYLSKGAVRIQSKAKT